MCDAQHWAVPGMMVSALAVCGLYMLKHRGTQVAYEKNADVALQLMVPRRAQWAPLRASVELIDVERLKLSMQDDAALMKEHFLLAANAARGGRDASPADKDTFANVHKLVRQTLFDGAPELVNDKLVEVGGWGGIGRLSLTHTHKLTGESRAILTRSSCVTLHPKPRLQMM
jgi:hypothetical protein